MAEPAPQTTLTMWELGRRQQPLDRAVTLLAGATGRSRDEATLADVGTRDVQLARVLTALAGSPVVACASCRCGELLDVEVDVAAVAAWPEHPPGTVLTVGTGPDRVTVRLPTTADLQALVDLDPDQGRLRLLDRCVVDGARPRSHQATAELVDMVSAAMEDAAPAGAVDVLIGCPGCGAQWATALDVPALLWAEIEVRALGLLREVHVLAAAYGWTEAEVLALPAHRRATYLQLVTT